MSRAISQYKEAELPVKPLITARMRYLLVGDLSGLANGMRVMGEYRRVLHTRFITQREAVERDLALIDRWLNWYADTKAQRKLRA